MNRCDLERLIGSEYGVKPDYPWAKYPTFAVFRHKENKKWFAVIMTIDKRKIGIDNDGKINVVIKTRRKFYFDGKLATRRFSRLSHE